MHKIYIERADRVMHCDVRMEIASIFGDGFIQWLSFFSKDSKTIAEAFAHAFQLKQFYIAIVDGKVAGMAACTSTHTRSIILNKKELRKHLGWYKGTIAGSVLKKEFEAPVQDLSKHTGSIEFVGTSSHYRGKGIASQLLRHIIDHAEFDEYRIDEVADTNTPAMKLYQKLGFEEYASKPVSAKKTEKIGINRFVSFRFVK